MVLGRFRGFFMVPGWFFMVLGRFFMVSHGPRLVFHGSRLVFHVFVIAPGFHDARWICIVMNGPRLV